MTALRSFVRSPIGPTATAVALGFASAPFVALTIVTESSPPFGRAGPFETPVDLPTAIGIACLAVLAGGLIGGTLGGRLIRRSPVAALLVAIAVAWPSAIATLPIVPTLLHVDYHSGFVCFSSCSPSINSGDVASGATSYVGSVISGGLLVFPPIGALVFAIAAWFASRRHWKRLAVGLGLCAITLFNFFSILGGSWLNLGGAAGSFALLVFGAVTWVVPHWQSPSDPSRVTPVPWDGRIQATAIAAFFLVAGAVVARVLVVSPTPYAPDVASLRMTVRDTSIEVHPALIPPGPTSVAVDDPATAPGSSLCIAGPFASAPVDGRLNETVRSPSCVDRPRSRWNLPNLDEGFYAFYIKSGSLIGRIAQIEVRGPSP
jgi:hypothetical protein